MTATARHPHLDAIEASPQATLPRPSWKVLHWKRCIDLPQHTRTAVTVGLSLIVGAALSTAYPYVGLSPLLFALVGLAGVVALFGMSHVWLCQPVERLARRLAILSTTDEPVRLRDLPTHRRDEVGVIARAVTDATDAAARHATDAKQLRRTLDHRVEKETRKACAHLQIETLQDPLTGLNNRRVLDDQLPALIKQAHARKQNLTCVMLDLDEFKKVNDTLGHAAGDALLKLIAELLRAAVRPADLAVRIGGDEFCIVLPDASPERAKALAAQVRSHFLHHQKSQSPQGPHADVSFGIACLHRFPTADASALLHAADQALYEHKARSR